MIEPLSFFLKKLLYLSTSIAFVILLFYFVAPPQYFSPALPFLLIFFMAVTLLSYYLIQKKVQANPRRYINAYLASSVARLFLYLIVIIIYLLMYRSDAINFLVSFFVLYVIYSAFEVSLITRKKS